MFVSSLPYSLVDKTKMCQQNYFPHCTQHSKKNSVAKHHFISLWTNWHANTHICTHFKFLTFPSITFHVIFFSSLSTAATIQMVEMIVSTLVFASIFEPHNNIICIHMQTQSTHLRTKTPRSHIPILTPISILFCLFFILFSFYFHCCAFILWIVTYPYVFNMACLL